MRTMKIIAVNALWTSAKGLFCLFFLAVAPPRQRRTQRQHLATLRQRAAIPRQSVQRGLPCAALQFPEQRLHWRRGQFGLQADQVVALPHQRHKPQAFLAGGRLDAQARIGRAAGMPK